MTDWYDLSIVKSYKMLSFDSVAEAYGLIYPLPSGENSSFVDLSSQKMTVKSVQVNHRATCPWKCETKDSQSQKV